MSSNNGWFELRLYCVCVPWCGLWSNFGGDGISGIITVNDSWECSAIKWILQVNQHLNY
jgi:hypothetical protein